MSKTRGQVTGRLLMGLGAAVGLTLLLMLVTAAAAVYLRVSDALLTALNQFMKLAAVVLGTSIAVGRGGKRGFLTGMALAMLYMILGYAGYVALGGNAFSAGEMLGEILIGAAVGGIAGSVISNLPAPGARRTKRLARAA